MMKNSKMLTLLALSCMALVGCNRGTSSTTKDTTKEPDSTPAAKVDLTIGCPNKQKDWMKAEVESFLTSEKLTDTYNVKMVQLEESDCNDATKVPDWTTGPDLFAYASDQTLGLVQKGVLADVPTAFANAMKTEMGDEVMAAGKIGAKTYGYPYAGDNGYFLYYNKSLFNGKEAKLDTLDGVVEVCKAAKLKLSYKLAEPFFSVGFMFTFGARYNVTLTADQKEIATITADFNGAKGLKAGKAMRNILNNDGIDTTKDGQKAPIAANGLGACVDGSWNAQTYQKAMGNDYGCIKLPTVTVDGETKNLSSFLGYKLYGVNKIKTGTDTKKQSTLHKLANFLVSKKVQEKRFDDLAIAPTNTEVKALKKVQDTPHVKAITSQAKFAVAQTIVPSGAWTETTNPYASLHEKPNATDTELQGFLETFNTAVTTK